MGATRASGRAPGLGVWEGFAEKKAGRREAGCWLAVSRRGRDGFKATDPASSVWFDRKGISVFFSFLGLGYVGKWN
jgi:hypothetical protein